MNIGWFGRRKHGADAFAQEEQHLRVEDNTTLKRCNGSRVEV